MPRFRSLQAAAQGSLPDAHALAELAENPRAQREIDALRARCGDRLALVIQKVADMLAQDDRPNAKPHTEATSAICSMAMLTRKAAKRQSIAARRHELAEALVVSTLLGYDLDSGEGTAREHHEEAGPDPLLVLLRDS